MFIGLLKTKLFTSQPINNNKRVHHKAWGVFCENGYFAGNIISAMFSGLFERVKNISSWQKTALLCLFYLSIFITYTFPFASHLSTAIIGKEDALVFAWNGYYFEHTLSQGSILHTNLMFYPWGESTLMHAGTISASIFSLPFSNKVLAINLYLIIHYILAAVGAYRLSRYLQLPVLFAVVAGFIFAFSPFKMARLAEHYNIAMSGFLPFFFLFYLKAFDFKSFTFFPKLTSKRYLLLALLWGVLQAITDFVLMFHMLYFAGIWLLFAFLRKLYHTAGLTITVAIVGLLITGLHFITKHLVKIGADDGGGLWWGGYWSDFVRPDTGLLYENMAGHNLRQTFERYNVTLEANAFLGYTLIAVFIFALYLFIKQQQNFIPRATLFSIICLVLIAIPEPFGYQKIYAPFSFLHFVPLLTNLRCPERVINIGYLLIAIFSFYQLNQNFKSEKWKRYSIALPVLIFIGLFAEYFPSNYTLNHKENIPHCINDLKNTETKAVLMYPFGIRDGYSQIGHFEVKHAMYQMVHGKKQLGGYFSRVSQTVKDRYLANEFINDLVIMQSDKDTVVGKKDYSSALDELNFDASLILNEDANKQGAVFISSILPEYGFKTKQCADGVMYIREK